MIRLLKRNKWVNIIILIFLLILIAMSCINFKIYILLKESDTVDISNKSSQVSVGLTSIDTIKSHGDITILTETPLNISTIDSGGKLLIIIKDSDTDSKIDIKEDPKQDEKINDTLQEDASEEIESEIQKNILEEGTYEYYLNQDYSWEDLVLLASVAHFESGEASKLESKEAVCDVIVNRKNAYDLWKYETYSDVVYDENQFSVTTLDCFDSLVDYLLHISKEEFENLDENVLNSIKAAHLVLVGKNDIILPADTYYFYGDSDKRFWGNLTYYTTIEGNSFFRDCTKN